ncbi:MAG: tRNA (5-methylaminomethyl-2-thiouridylate)-methyltransferase [Methylococcales bacterium]|jgi:tRNA-uridine 2-sulfurtransferase|nr:tRNA (5-methylaminomethyl-2-thiouridylate)-methyltransferase [Methylococcales bacterium]MBT7445046.1 tRNA (5-methylaminomethyl-2-thiouridylate)-methyltransferase [Methylococcales bacterium]
MERQRKAVALISGGLDSLLAAKVMLDQGIHVEGINFFTGFCVEGHTHAIRKKDKDKQKRNNALWSAEQLGIKLHIVDIIEEYKDIVINPKHGYGKNLNPCLDCKIFMVKKAYEWIQEHDFDFIITGEVIGQRPMSQRKEILPVVANESGAEDLLLRPLCAKNLPETKVEREGWVDREKLHDFSGRNRKPQMALAKAMNFEDYATPAGGCCFLTDKSYSKKLGDLWEHRGEKKYELDDIMLLKVGRHIRPNERFKMIVSREEGENHFLQGYRKQFDSLQILNFGGPMTLVDGITSDEDCEVAAKIVARYSQGKHEKSVTVEYRRKDGEVFEINVAPFKGDEIPEIWHV